MEVAYSSKALEDIDYWKETGNKKIQEKITQLIEDIQSHPSTGIGKPEPLKHALAGKWSRKIDKKHRVIYAIKVNILYIYSLKKHY